MEKTKFNAQVRESAGKGTKTLRKSGLVPAVLYGKGIKNQNLSVSLHDFQKLYREVGTSSIILLNIDGKGEKNVLIQDLAINPVTSVPEHVDFYEVSMTEKITTTIPLTFVGDSVAVIEMDGSLITNKDEVEIECLPADLPPSIEVDISVLTDFEKSIHVSDLNIPEGVTVKDDSEEMVATVEPPRSEEELAELEEAPEEVAIPESEHGEGEETAPGEGGEEGEAAAGDEKPAEGGEEPNAGKKEDKKE